MRLAAWQEEPLLNKAPVVEVVSTSADDWDELIWDDAWDVVCVHVKGGAPVADQVELSVRGVSFEAQLCRRCRLAV